jgi:hypothetical protein
MKAAATVLGAFVLATPALRGVAQRLLEGL